MSILIEILVFLVVIIVLILVHELGHFVVAKLSGMRVDEFGIGYPPRALTLGKIGETEYTLNWLPFGGFVRIFGEDGAPQLAEDGTSIPADPRAFTSKPRILQALVLVAGVFMNALLAYILITLTLVMGTQQALSPDQVASGTAKDVQVAVEAVVPGSPADKAGFMAGDFITGATTTTKNLGINYDGTNPAGTSALINSDTGLTPMQFGIIRNGKPMTIIATPQLNILKGATSTPALGVELTNVGIIKTPLAQAPLLGAQLTWEVTKETAIAFWNLLKGLVTFSANLSEVSGPIGIAGAVGQATSAGIAALLSLTALISINLALVNLIPIPALDGGRLLFVIIETIIRKPINPKIAERVNAVGFLLLLLLMFVVSAHDIFNLFK